MDEVDGMGSGDRSGISELIRMIKSSKVPIICICNDRQKVKSLLPYCLDLKYRRPTKNVIARRAVEVGKIENMIVEINAAEAIAESCGNDIRQVLNCLQMWANNDSSSSTTDTANNDNNYNSTTRSSCGALTYGELKKREKVINKDEILRVSMFDATKLIVEGRKGLGGDGNGPNRSNDSTSSKKNALTSLYQRTDAFFVDYAMIGLMVHQNYVKVITPRFLQTRNINDDDAELDILQDLYGAANSMSDFAVVEDAIRGGGSGQNWSLLPVCASLAVRTGSIAGGTNGSYLSGYPEFASWFGKNSSKMKKIRILKELNHHMNYRISCDLSQVRMEYIPTLRKYFLHLLLMGDDDNDQQSCDNNSDTGTKTTIIQKVIETMDEYGLDRDDLFENLDEFVLDMKAKLFSTSLDSKAKANFTREYNKSAHKSQALVDEQGSSSKSKRRNKVLKVGDDDNGDNLIDDEVAEGEEEEDDDDDFDEDALRKLFKSSSKKKSTNKKGGKRSTSTTTGGGRGSNAKSKKKR